MYYRITKAKVQSDKFEEAMATMESLRESIGKINGLVSSNLVQISETEMKDYFVFEITVTKSLIRTTTNFINSFKLQILVKTIMSRISLRLQLMR